MGRVATENSHANYKHLTISVSNSVFNSKLLSNEQNLLLKTLFLRHIDPCLFPMPLSGASITGLRKYEVEISKPKIS